MVTSTSMVYQKEGHSIAACDGQARGLAFFDNRAPLRLPKPLNRNPGATARSEHCFINLKSGYGLLHEFLFQIVN